ncbi:MAG TPA: PAS domain S-box protein, partial [Chloroflexota bacterium]|nr:PAS domain S-box protein [Chloroflexota bacterium]
MTNQPSRLADAARLAALDRTALLDSPPEETFDRYTRLATRIAGVPVSLVSLVDNRRQFFKSQQGLGEPWASARETPLRLSFCRHVVASGEALVVDDARQDPLLKGEPGIDALGVVAYCGVPLRTEEGHVLGALCAIDSEPHSWAPDVVRALGDVAAAVVTEISLRAAAADRQRETVRAEREAARWKGVLESALDAVILMDGSGAIVEVNRAAEAMFEIRREEAVGRPLEEVIIPPGLREAHREGLERHQATGEARILGRRVEITGMRAGGDEFPLELTVTAVRHGQETLYASTLRDITQRLAAEREIRRQRDFAQQVMDALGQGLTVTDGEGRFEFVNPAYARMAGRRAEGLIGLSPSEVTAPDDHAALDEARAARRAGQSTSYETRLLRPTGETVPVLVTGVPRWEEGVVRGTIAAVTDLTERKAAERMRERFISMVTHELRTPLGVVKGYATTLLGRHAPREEAVRRRCLEEIVGASDELLELVNTLLDISRLQSGAFELEVGTVEVAPLLTGAVERVLAGGRAGAVVCRVAGREGGVTAVPAVAADQRRVTQVLCNLVDNALKHGAGAPVEVTAAAHEGGVLFSVTDSGPGIPPDEVDAVFQPFERGRRSREEEIAGTGLGLTIVRAIVEAHGGRIWVESPAPGRAAGPEQGACFRFTLPCAAEARHAGGAAQ